MWNERAEFDIYRSHINGTTPHRRHILIVRSVQIIIFHVFFVKHHLKHIKGTSGQTPTNVSFSGNPNITPVPTTPIRGHSRGSQQTMTNRSSASSSSAYPPPPNSDLV